MIWTNRANLPEHLVTILKAAHEAAQGHYLSGRTVGSRVISVTKLISPPQKRHLEQIHAKDLTMDVLDTVPALRGTALHHILELAGKDAPEAIPEERLTVEFNGWTITGKSDVFVTKDFRLVEFKDSSVWAFIFGKREWTAQLNVLRWIRERKGGYVASLEVDLFVGDWRRGEAKRDEKYPPRVVMMPIDKWTMDETERFILERLALHESQTPPPCSSEERWQKPTRWAAKKANALRATKVFDEERDALQFAQKSGLTVEKRPGESTRCLDYCAAAPFCRQWAADPTNPVNDANGE